MAATVPACRFCMVTRICSSDPSASAMAGRRIALGWARQSWNMLYRASPLPSKRLTEHGARKGALGFRRSRTVYCSSAIPLDEETPKQKHSSERQRQSKTRSGTGGRRKSGEVGDEAAGTSSREDVRTLRIKKVCAQYSRFSAIRNLAKFCVCTLSWIGFALSCLQTMNRSCLLTGGNKDNFCRWKIWGLKGMNHMHIPGIARIPPQNCRRSMAT